MIQLYGMPGACSLAPHIVLQELGLPFELKLLKRGDDSQVREELKKINPMGQIPALMTEEGYPLTEGVAIMQYLISKKENNLFPKSGKERFKAFEWMNFIATTLHKAFIPLFNPKSFSDDETHFETLKKVARNHLDRLLRITEGKFSEGEYALGNSFTVVDAYLFVVLGWTQHFNIDLSPYKKLKTFVDKVAKRPSVMKAMKEEGLS